MKDSSNSVYLGGAKSLVDGLGRLDSRPVNAPVKEEHDQHGQEETTERRVDDVARIVGQFTRPVVAVLQRRVPIDLAVVPSDQRRETNDETEEPNDGQKYFGAGRCHDRWVGDGPRDGQVAIQTDGAQVEDGGGAHPDVDGQPDGAPNFTENPHVQHFQ